MSKLQFEGEPWVILKPTGVMEHQGGTRFEIDSPEHQAFQEMIARLENPVECQDEEDIVHAQKEYVRLAETLWAGTEPLAPAPMADRDIFELLGFD